MTCCTSHTRCNCRNSNSPVFAYEPCTITIVHRFHARLSSKLTCTQIFGGLFGNCRTYLFFVNPYSFRLLSLGPLSRFSSIMALPHWMNITLRLVSNVTSFLLNDPPAECPLASLSHEERYRHSDSSAGILDAAFSFVATSVGLDLPRTLTVVDGLTVATAFLLRLTESVPAEVLLFPHSQRSFLLVIRCPSLRVWNCWCGWSPTEAFYTGNTTNSRPTFCFEYSRKHQVLCHCLPLNCPLCLTRLRHSSQRHQPSLCNSFP